MILLLTPTGGRHKVWPLCEKWMKSQTYQDFLWIIIDDCEPHQTYTFHEKQIIYFAERKWDGKTNTQKRNLLCLLTQAKQLMRRIAIDFITIIEDDEYYKEGHLEEMIKSFSKGVDLVGEAHVHFYNVETKHYNFLDNESHACLCRTMFRPKMIDKLMDEVKTKDVVIDKNFWLKHGEKGLIKTDSFNSIGVKGLPGRKGITQDHDSKFVKSCKKYHPDNDLSVFYALFGKAASDYQEFIKTS